MAWLTWHLKSYHHTILKKIQIVYHIENNKNFHGHIKKKKKIKENVTLNKETTTKKDL